MFPTHLSMGIVTRANLFTHLSVTPRRAHTTLVLRCVDFRSFYLSIYFIHLLILSIPLTFLY
jgi:hypothetical protein